VLSALISRFGGTDSGGTLAEARTLNALFFQAEQTPWALPYVQAAFRAWWLAEYGGWYGENADGSIPDNQMEEGASQRTGMFFYKLR
jgi:nuclear pore complex protein Nup205